MTYKTRESIASVVCLLLIVGCALVWVYAVMFTLKSWGTSTRGAKTIAILAYGFGFVLAALALKVRDWIRGEPDDNAKR